MAALLDDITDLSMKNVHFDKKQCSFSFKIDAKGTSLLVYSLSGLQQQVYA